MQIRFFLHIIVYTYSPHPGRLSRTHSAPEDVKSLLQTFLAFPLEKVCKTVVFFVFLRGECYIVVIKSYCGCYTIATQNASYANSFPDKSFCIGSFFHHSCEPICVLTRSASFSIFNWYSAISFKIANLSCLHFPSLIICAL